MSIINLEATIYVFGNRNLFKNLYYNNTNIETTNRFVLSIKDIDKCLIQLSKDNSLTFTQILFMFNIKINLISITTLENKNIEYYFSSKRFIYLNYKS